MSICTLCGAVGAPEDIEKHSCTKPAKGKVKQPLSELEAV